MKNSTVLIIFLTIVILHISCNNNSSTEPEANDVILPLSIGNKWTYIDSTFYDDGIEVDTFTQQISSKIQINYNNDNLEVFCLNWKLPENAPEISYLYRNEENGLILYGAVSENDTIICKDLYLEYPTHIFKSSLFSFIGWGRNNFKVIDTIRIECVDTDKLFYTPLGEFICYVYKYNIESVFLYYPCYCPDAIGYPCDCYQILAHFEIYEYYAPNIGKIGKITKTYKIIYKSVLMDYEIK